MFFAPVATAPGCPSAFNNACLQEIVPYCKPCQYIVENSVETVETPVPVESFQHSPKELVVFSWDKTTTTELWQVIPPWQRKVTVVL